MILDLRPLLRGETNKIDIDYLLTPEPLDGVTFESDVHVMGSITDRAGLIELVVRCSVPYHGECARCLDSVSGVHSLDFVRVVSSERSAKEETGEDGVYDDDYLIPCDGRLDVDSELREELLLSFPQRLLCDEDCPGLCPKCGKPKRLGSCSCSTKEIDPRLAVLKQLLHGDSEGNSEVEK